MTDLPRLPDPAYKPMAPTRAQRRTTTRMFVAMMAGLLVVVVGAIFGLTALNEHTYDRRAVGYRALMGRMLSDTPELRANTSADIANRRKVVAAAVITELYRHEVNRLDPPYTLLREERQQLLHTLDTGEPLDLPMGTYQEWKGYENPWTSWGIWATLAGMELFVLVIWLAARRIEKKGRNHA